jgi:hypothetical protein
LIITGNTQQLPELAGRVDGLQEVVPFGRGSIYTYPEAGAGNIIVGGDNLPDRFGETSVLAFRNNRSHPRYGDRIVARRTDKMLFGLVKYVQPHLEEVTRRSHRTELRTNHLALRIDGDVPELPEAPQLFVEDEEGMIEFWGSIIDRLKADFDNR